MATYNINEENNVVKVKVSLSSLPKQLKEARKAKETITVANIRNMLKNKGIEVLECIKGDTISNISGPGAVADFIFTIVKAKATSTKEETQETNTLTNDEESVIMDGNIKKDALEGENSTKASKKRKRSKNEPSSKKNRNSSE